MVISETGSWEKLERYASGSEVRAAGTRRSLLRISRSSADSVALSTLPVTGRLLLVWNASIAPRVRGPHKPSARPVYSSSRPSVYWSARSRLAPAPAPKLVPAGMPPGNAERSAGSSGMPAAGVVAAPRSAASLEATWVVSTELDEPLTSNLSSSVNRRPISVAPLIKPSPSTSARSRRTPVRRGSWAAVLRSMALPVISCTNSVRRSVGTNELSHT